MPDTLADSTWVRALDAAQRPEVTVRHVPERPVGGGGH